MFFRAVAQIDSTDYHFNKSLVTGVAEERTIEVVSPSFRCRPEPGTPSTLVDLEFDCWAYRARNVSRDAFVVAAARNLAPAERARLATRGCSASRERTPDKPA